MAECKDCSCELKYANNNMFNNMKNTKNILCKKNNTNYKFMMPLEVMFYLTSFSFMAYYNYNYNKVKKNQISYN